MTLNCAKCNTPLSKGSKCKHCGRNKPITKIAREKARLAKFQLELKNGSSYEFDDLVAHGFMPETAEGLILAGLDMLPLLRSNYLSTDSLEAAQERISTIVAHLRSCERTDTVEIAIAEFEKVEGFDQWINHYGQIMIGIMVFVIMGICAMIELMN
ncbi:MAG: hypothetical protein AB8G95_11930 [Anaerolineae bacterium]